MPPTTTPLSTSLTSFKTNTFSVTEMRLLAEQASQLLKTLGNPDRLLLLCQLTQGERCVSDLEEATQIHQPTLSQQLGVLREESLVNTRREGKQIFYSISSQDALAVMQVLYTRLCGRTEQ
jgi:ArsR family transcriptional regulator